MTLGLGLHFDHFAGFGSTQLSALGCRNAQLSHVSSCFFTCAEASK